MENLDIGFLGGDTVSPVGSAEYFLSFFNYVKKSINTKSFLNIDGRYLICDRLYKRYVKLEDLEATTTAMEFIKHQFQFIIHPTGALLDNYFKDIFNSYFKRYKNVTEILKEYETKNLIRIVVAELPYCAIDTERSLEKLDTWDGPPFWTRFYLKELYDQGKEIPELPF